MKSDLSGVTGEETILGIGITRTAKMASLERDALLSEKMIGQAKRPFTFDDAYSTKEQQRPTPRRRRNSRSWFTLPLAGTLVLGLYLLYPTGLPTKIQNSQIPTSDAILLKPNFSCTPDQPCWPTAKEWSVFNHSINGALKATVPWASKCYSVQSSQDKADCDAVAAGYMDGTSRSQQYGAMEFLDWESCGSENCHLDSFKPASPVDGTCALGRLSAYHVDARTPDAIIAALTFAQKHNIRISIKNTGHDYFGRSGAPNSLAIWTHHMKDTKYYKTFQPKNCKTEYTNVGLIGAGVQAEEAWQFFEPLDMMVTVGAVGSVGIAGGYGQGGGHGPLAPKYGLMVDQAIEFDIITAQGQYRTINECTDPDLFWAMRGGGGGTYAVLVNYKFQLHPAVPINVHSFRASFPSPPKGEKLNISESTVHKDIIRSLAQNQTLFAEHGIAGYNFILPTHIVSLQVHPSSDTSALARITSQYQTFLSTHPNLTITENKYYTFTKFSDWHAFTLTPEIARNGAVGIGLSESGRFIPRPRFASSGKIDELVDAVVSAMQFSYERGVGGSAHLYATGPFNHPDNSKTGVNPGWRTALWHVIMGGIWTTSTPPDTRAKIQDTISRSIEPFKKVTPGGGCYMNEGDWAEENWKTAFFGENYERLERVKRKWDPEGVFNCWKCVGWNGVEE